MYSHFVTAFILCRYTFVCEIIFCIVDECTVLYVCVCSVFIFNVFEKTFAVILMQFHHMILLVVMDLVHLHFNSNHSVVL